MEPLKTSIVHRNLDARLRLLGMEAHDLALVLLLGSVMNLLFGKSGIGFYATFALPGIVALVLFFVKRGRPDNFLLHLFRYHVTPGIYSAGEESRHDSQLRKKIYEAK